jgi:hypothetical protein
MTLVAGDDGGGTTTTTCALLLLLLLPVGHHRSCSANSAAKVWAEAAPTSGDIVSSGSSQHPEDKRRLGWGATGGWGAHRPL